MIRKEIDGKVYFEFEPHEKKAREKFEAAVDVEDVAQELADLFIAIRDKLKKSCREAWKELAANFPESDNKILKYHYLAGRVEVGETSEVPPCDPT